MDLSPYEGYCLNAENMSLMQFLIIITDMYTMYKSNLTQISSSTVEQIKE